MASWRGGRCSDTRPYTHVRCVLVRFGEGEALAAYAPDRFDLVVMNYMLQHGNGLHLLQELRARDSVIPVIAISGVAPSTVALDLIQAGADDYFDKSDLDTRRLVKSIRESLGRAGKLKHRAAAPVDFGTLVSELSRDFADRLGGRLHQSPRPGDLRRPTCGRDFGGLRRLDPPKS